MPWSAWSEVGCPAGATGVWRQDFQGAGMNGKAAVMTALAVACFVSGVIDQYFYPNMMYPPTVLPSTAVCVFLIFLWYRIDSTQVGYRRSPWLNVGVVGISLVALPYYFFRSRGARRGALATLFLFLAFIASSVLYMAGAMAVYVLGGAPR